MLHQYFAKFEFIFVLIFFYNLSVFISFHISIYCSYEQCWIVSSFSIRLIDHTLWNHALTELFQFLLFYNWYYWTEYIHVYGIFPFCLICCCSVAKSCWTLWYFMNCSTPSFPVLHYLPELAQTHVRWVTDAIQPSHPLLPPSPLAFNLSQHQGLFQWVGSSHQVATVLKRQL